MAWTSSGVRDQPLFGATPNLLTRNQGLRRLRGRYVICMTVHDLPGAVLRPIYLRDPQVDRDELGSIADLRCVSLDLDGERKFRALIFRDEIEALGSASMPVGRRPLHGFLNLLPSVCGRAKGIRHGDVFSVRIGLLEGLRIA